MSDTFIDTLEGVAAIVVTFASGVVGLAIVGVGFMIAIKYVRKLVGAA